MHRYCYGSLEVNVQSKNELIYTHKVNSNQTFRDQQEQGRRPRFSIMKDIIEPHNLNPVIEGTLSIEK